MPGSFSLMAYDSDYPSERGGLEGHTMGLLCGSHSDAVSAMKLTLGTSHVK